MIDLHRFPYPEDCVPMMIGTATIVLYRTDYDPAQGWFSFMQGATIPIPVSAFEMGPPEKPRHRNPGIPSKFARCDGIFRIPFVYERGVEQITLPFHEFRKLSNKAHTRCEQARYPGWEKCAPGDDRPHRIDFKPEHHTDIVNWCAINCFGSYHVKRQHAFFELEKDAMMVKIFWQKAAA